MPRPSRPPRLDNGSLKGIFMNNNQVEEDEIGGACGTNDKLTVVPNCKKVFILWKPCLVAVTSFYPELDETILLAKVLR
jgi:hypothetical protein